MNAIDPKSELRARAGRAIVIVLPFLFFVLFFYMPLGSLLGRALTDSAQGTWTFSQIADVLSSAHLLGVISFTIQQALLSALLSILIGVALGYFLANTSFPGRNFVRSLTIVPFALPPIAVAIGFMVIYGRSGFLASFFTNILGFEEMPIKIIFTLPGILLAHAFYNAPIVARFVSAAWERIPRRYEEGAYSLGASKLRVFRDVTLPMLSPAILSGGTLAFIFSFLSFPIVAIIGGAFYSTVEYEVYRLVWQFNESGTGVALASLALVFSVAFMWLYLWVDRFSSHRLVAGAPRVPKSLAARWLYMPIFGLLVLFFLAPILGIFVDSFTRITSEGLKLTLDWYGAVLNPTYSQGLATPPLFSIWNSLKYAVVVTLISLGIGTLLSIVLAQQRRLVSEMIFMIPLAVSPVALGLAILLSYSRPPLDISGLGIAVIIAHTMLAIPFVIRAVRPAISQLDGRLPESARSLGAPPRAVLWEIMLPLIRGSLVVGAVFAFAISIAEMSATIMIVGQDSATMPLSVFLLSDRSNYGAPSAMSAIMIVVLGLSFYIMDRFGRRDFA